MSKQELTPWEQANTDMPLSWYEKKLPVVVGFTLGSSGYLYGAYHTLSSGRPLMQALVGVSIYALSEIADHKSTVHGLSAVDDARDIGIENTYREEPGIDYKPHNITTKDDYTRYSLSRSGALHRTAVTALSALAPEGGAAIAATKILCAFNNRRKTQRVRHAIDIQRERNS